ncbi:MAG: hypothetical protein Q7K55_09515 [Candidatus Levybacteria bacterium]|nr:hypothetical protein [Candidatus Levybacteria bacterium]
MDAEEYKKKIEKDVLEIIEKKLKEGEIKAERAKEIAGYVYDALHPRLSIDQIYKIAQNFDDHFPELKKVVVDASYDYEDRLREVVTKQVDKLISQNKIEEADTLLEKALNKEINVEE